MPNVTGIIKVYINGELHRTKEGEALSFGGKEKTAQVGHALYGFSSKFAPAEIEFTIAHMADTDVIALNEVDDASVRFVTDTGVAYLITNANVTSPAKLTGGEGDCEFTMQGDPAEKE
jgi:hypothetical protein